MWATLNQNSDLSVFVSRMNDRVLSDIRALIDHPTPKTLFVPNNRALLDFDWNDTPGAIAIFQMHFLAGIVKTTNLLSGPNIRSTFLTNSNYVQLPGGQGALLKLTLTGSNLQLSWSVNAPQYQANVISGQGDLDCTNGVIHVVDHVLGIPANLFDTLSRGQWTNYAAAINQGGAETIGMVSTPGTTLFVPSNEAWQFSTDSSEKCFDGVPGWKDLTGPQMHQMLRFHTLSGVIPYSNMTSNMCYVSVQGQPLCIDRTGSGQVWLTDKPLARRLAMVTNRPGELGNSSDIPIRNGMLHVTDKVMIAFEGANVWTKSQKYY